MTRQVLSPKTYQFLRKNKNQLAVLCFFVLFLALRACFMHPEVDTFARAKHILEDRIYFDHPVTFYCNAEYDENKAIIPPPGFQSRKFASRAALMEWEHAMPVENFGKNFKEWRSGHPDCENNGRKFYGRKCVSLANDRFRKMEADMYNIFPSIGAVNAARGNRSYDIVPFARQDFGSCPVKIKGKKFEPPDSAKGEAARAMLYMAARYPEAKITAAQKNLYENWSKVHPVTEWECTRAKRIEKIQVNPNEFVKNPCMDSGMWN